MRIKQCFMFNYNYLTVSSRLSLDVTTYLCRSNYLTKILFLSLLSLHTSHAQCNLFLNIFIFRLINTALQSTQALPFYYSLQIIYGLFWDAALSQNVWQRIAGRLVNREF